MIGLAYGVAAVLVFVLIITAIHSYMEMNFDKRATEVFDEDDERTDEELKIIHKNQLPIRGLLLVMTTFAADMRYLAPTIMLICVAACIFWILFDIFCAVIWLGKPWYYVGDPPPMNPYAFFALKVIALAIFTLLYVLLIQVIIPVPYVPQLNLYALLGNH